MFPSLPLAFSQNKTLTALLFLFSPLMSLRWYLCNEPSPCLLKLILLLRLPWWRRWIRRLCRNTFSHLGVTGRSPLWGGEPTRTTSHWQLEQQTCRRKADKLGCNAAVLTFSHLDIFSYVHYLLLPVILHFIPHICSQVRFTRSLIVADAVTVEPTWNCRENLEPRFITVLTLALPKE